MLTAVAVAVALNIDTMGFKELSKYFWDCDTAYVTKSLEGEDIMNCVVVTEKFKAMFFTPHIFTQYWDIHRYEEWAKRGYTPHRDHEMIQFK